MARKTTIKECSFFKMSEFDECAECGCTCFYQDTVEWHRTCTNCGLQSCLEWTTSEDMHTPMHSKKENYFVNTIIMGAIKAGAPLKRSHVDQLNMMFLESVRRFNHVKNQIGRQNYPSYQYAFYRLALSLGIDISSYIKLPKMGITLENVIRDWPMIDPTV